MPILARQTLVLAASTEEVEQALRTAIRARPGIADVRVSKSQYYSPSRPWMGSVGNGSIEAVRQTLNPSGIELHVKGTLKSRGKGSELDLFLNFSWFELLIACLIFGSAIYLPIHSLIASGSTTMDRWISLGLGVAIACLVPSEMFRRVRQVRREFAAMSEPACADDGTPTG